MYTYYSQEHFVDESMAGDKITGCIDSEQYWSSTR